MILKKCLFGLFLIFCLNTAYADNIAKAEPPHGEYVPVREYTRNPHVQHQPSSNVNTVVDDVLDIIRGSQYEILKQINVLKLKGE